MSDLSPEAKALLDGTRSLGGPSAAQKLAMKKAVLASAAAPAAAVAVKTALGFKVGLGVAVAVAGASAWIALAPRAEPKLSQAPALQVEAPEVAPAPEDVVAAAPDPAPVAAPEPARARPPAPKPVVAEPEPTPVAAPPPPVPVAPVVDEATLSRELSAIEDANETVREGRFDDVLTQLQRYEDEFPHGALSTEAAVVKVLALCGLGRVDEARAIGGKLPANNPAVRRLERSCLK